MTQTAWLKRHRGAVGTLQQRIAVLQDRVDRAPADHKPYRTREELAALRLAVEALQQRMAYREAQLAQQAADGPDPDGQPDDDPVIPRPPRGLGTLRGLLERPGRDLPPEGVCPVIGAYLTGWARAARDPHAPASAQGPLLVGDALLRSLLGTDAGSEELAARRGNLLVDHFIRVVVPWWLAAAESPGDANRLRVFPPIDGPQHRAGIRPVLDGVRHRAHARRLASGVPERHAADDATLVACRVTDTAWQLLLPTRAAPWITAPEQVAGCVAGEMGWHTLASEHVWEVAIAPPPEMTAAAVQAIIAMRDLTSATSPLPSRWPAAPTRPTSGMPID